MIEFKIINAADQQFSAILEDRRVTLRLRYNTVDDRWSLDLAIDDVPVLLGRKVVTGVDLLAAFNFQIGMIFALSETSDNVEPGRSQLPDGLVKLYHTGTL